MGAWVNYGLGSDCQNLPGFIVINGGLIPPGGLAVLVAGSCQPAIRVRYSNRPVAAWPNISAPSQPPQRQRHKLDLINQLDAFASQQFGQHDSLESAIRNYELAYAMQMAVPEVMSLDQETAATKAMYGLESSFEPTRIYAAQCLIARRIIEKGVRFVELTCPKVDGDRWDQHGNLKEGHENNARAVDQPIAALLKDLRSRGMLDETLVVWAGEFGRTPFAQGKNGRDHNQFGFLSGWPVEA